MRQEFRAQTNYPKKQIITNNRAGSGGAALLLLVYRKNKIETTQAINLFTYLEFILIGAVLFSHLTKFSPNPTLISPLLV